MAGVELVETRSLQEQATAAALILRQCLETPGRTGCLVTPDRQLARRVKAELRRWNIAIDDSAGEPLIRYGRRLAAQSADRGPAAILLRRKPCRPAAPSAWRAFGATAEQARAAMPA